MELEPILHDLEHLPAHTWNYESWFPHGMYEGDNFRERLTTTYNGCSVSFSRYDEGILLQMAESGIALSLRKDNASVFAVHKPFPHKAKTEEEKHLAERLEQAFERISQTVLPQKRTIH